ncbi:MAG: DUF4386 domain-containing protein [Microcoleus sp.]
MQANKKIAVVTGILFIVATFAALLAAAIEPILTRTDYLASISANANKVTVDILFYLIAAFTSVGIAISMYPVMKKSNVGLSIGSLVFRTIEAVFYIVAVVSLLSVLTLSRKFMTAEASDRAVLQVVGDSFLRVREHATLAAVFAFSVGAFMYYYLFFQSGLVPRWLSGWGIVATILMLTACVLSLFSDRPVTGYAILIIPIAVQEMVLAVWLIIKGFNVEEPPLS